MTIKRGILHKRRILNLPHLWPCEVKQEYKKSGIQSPFELPYLLKKKGPTTDY